MPPSEDEICTVRKTIDANFAVSLFVLLLVGIGQAQDPLGVAVPTTAIPEARPATAAGPAVPKAPKTPAIKVQPLSVTIQLTDEGTKFTGTLSGLDQWPMKTSFGETNVPLSAVAGIKFAEEGHPSTTIVLHNGDSVTGALDLNHVQIETSWGKAEIDSGHIKSMLFAPGLVWTTEPGLNGNRWKLVADKETRTTVARPVINTPAAGGDRTIPNSTNFGANNPGAANANVTNPAAVRPNSPQAGFAQPNFPQPGFSQPGFAQPGFAQPGFGQPPARPLAPASP